MAQPHGQTEEVLELSGEDADGDTKCKADRNRLRDEFDQIAEWHSPMMIMMIPDKK